jgi:hypothetical protein
MYPWLWFLGTPRVPSVEWRRRAGDRAHHELVLPGIRPSAGDAEIEAKAFSIASYGKQLGLITEVLVDLAEQVGTTSVQVGRIDGATEAHQRKRSSKIKTAERGEPRG